LVNNAFKTTATSIFVGRLLLPKLVNRLTEAHDRALAAIGLTVKQAAILLSCDLKEANTPAELAGMYGLEVSSITRMVERLERKGLLKHVRNRADRRQVILQITARGKQALRQAVPIASQVASQAWQGVTKNERVVLDTIVTKVMNNLNHRGAQKQMNKLK